MVKKNSSNYRKCGKCSKLKPIGDFITGKKVTLQITYSRYCKPCTKILEHENKVKTLASGIRKDDQG